MPKFQPSMTKIVGGVAFQRNKMATILYMYRLGSCIEHSIDTIVCDKVVVLKLMIKCEGSCEIIVYVFIPLAYIF